jgi:hypothetical protein
VVAQQSIADATAGLAIDSITVVDGVCAPAPAP